MKVGLSGLARRDLRDILLDLASDNSNAALALDDRFTERFQQLSRFPELGRPRFDVLPGARGILVSPYVIFYRAGPSSILILRVLHSSRDFNNTPLQ